MSPLERLRLKALGISKAQIEAIAEYEHEIKRSAIDSIRVTLTEHVPDSEYRCGPAYIKDKINKLLPEMIK